MKVKILAGLIVLISLSSLVHATVRVVPDDYPTIGAAVQACNDGDEIIVNDGVYSGDGNRDIMVDKNITIKSKNGPENCIIDCNNIKGSYRAFVVRSDAVIAGFTIINGYAEEGGAVSFECCDNSSQLINCVLRNNFANRRGGAIFCNNANPLIINCNINNNYAGEAGGGIFCENSNVSIQNTTVSDNFCTGDNPLFGGGGIACWQESNVTLQNCTISNNISGEDAEGRGGGIYCSERSSLTINNSEIKGNTARSGHIAFGGGIFCSNRSSLVLNNSAIINNRCEADDCYGGGIYYESDLNSGTKCTIACSTIKNNISNTTEQNDRSYGGGMYFRNAKPLISKCIISNNSAHAGSGAICESSHLIVAGSIISGNHPLNRYRYGGGGIQCINSDVAIENCSIIGNSSFGIGVENGNNAVNNSILYYNGDGRKDFEQIQGNSVAVTYSDVQTSKYPSWPGEGNINVDPCFVEPGHWDTNAVWTEGYYHLLSDSLCIDAAKLSAYQLGNTDLDNNPRVSGSSIDMGAYEFKNSEPVADAGADQQAYAWIDNIAKVTLDGSASYDADDDTLTYNWTWVIDGNEHDANGINPVVDLPVGEHTITLVVNDGTSNSEPDEVKITVTEPVEASVWFYPTVIHRHGRNGNIIAWIQLPESITKDQVDDRALTLYPGDVNSVRQQVFEYNRGGKTQAMVLAFFDKNELLDAIGDDGKTKLSVIGKLITGQYFYGNNTIWIK